MGRTDPFFMMGCIAAMPTMAAGAGMVLWGVCTGQHDLALAGKLTMLTSIAMAGIALTAPLTESLLMLVRRRT